jgi:1-deoxy-D-xylulose-5-phosphate reductoisomerase
MAAVEAGRTVALANKEALVTAGALMTEAAVRSGATLLPVDSEHNAIFQCLACSRNGEISRIILTASGGPFRTASAETMREATPAQAVAHPNWSMGAKISIDSATMMNKGLELIEAHHLFGVPSNRIEIVIHPQSVVHSLVEFVDGSVLAQLGSPDMRIPIAYALAWPERIRPRRSDSIWHRLQSWSSNSLISHAFLRSGSRAKPSRPVARRRWF